MHTGRTPYEDEGGEPGDACTSQGISKIANKPGQAMREAQNRLFLTALIRKSSRHLDLGLWGFRTVRQFISVFKHSVCSTFYGSLSTLIQELFIKNRTIYCLRGNNKHKNPFPRKTIGYNKCTIFLCTTLLEHDNLFPFFLYNEAHTRRIRYNQWSGVLWNIHIFLIFYPRICDD